MSKKYEQKLPKTVLNSKPFCDCMCCTCKNCPDVLQMLSITVSDTTCHFGSKVQRDDGETSEINENSNTPNILDVLNHNRNCNCGVVARGIRDHVHKNIGMSERREQIKNLIKTCDERCKEHNTTSATGGCVITEKKSKDQDKPPCVLCESYAKDLAKDSKTSSKAIKFSTDDQITCKNKCKSGKTNCPRDNVQ